MNLQMEHIINIRELGKIRTEDGKFVRENVLIRSAHLHDISSEDLRQLYEQYQIRHVIDFRDIFECIKKPDYVIPLTQYHHLPVLSDFFRRGGKKESKFSFGEHPRLVFQEIYETMASGKSARDAYRGFFEILLQANGEAVLWHCTQGKDRTGIAAALLLTVLGVSKETIIDEYLLSNQAMQKEYEQLQNSQMSEERLTFMREILFVYREHIERYYDIIEKEYHTLYEYIVSQLISEDEAEKLRNAYLCESI